MTTPYALNPLWPGATVAVLASGPSLTPALAESMRLHKTIAVNEAHRLAPWADVLVGLDGNWPAAWRAFPGQRLTGVADETLDADYIGPMWERVTLAPGHTIEIRNSGLAAVRIAAALGAARIVLAGFDHPRQPGHFYDDEVDAGHYTGLAEGLAALTAELAARGIMVERAALPEGPAPASPPPDPKARRVRR